MKTGDLKVGGMYVYTDLDESEVLVWLDDCVVDSYVFFRNDNDECICLSGRDVEYDIREWEVPPIKMTFDLKPGDNIYMANKEEPDNPFCCTIDNLYAHDDLFVAFTVMDDDYVFIANPTEPDYYDGEVFAFFTWQEAVNTAMDFNATKK
jgi:hypothetical protein